ncbi:hypothetical protein B0I72DRAFT_137833 [Yarrowia lipolytica]|uniref:YALI0A06886p n=2 Tax=Yarrowia lipolytica TaxID=4952 RepID=Q6CHN6_YARLI|nr:YALI0A06886p [Yarrowia lipolytica CLIB122]AOW00334.1 hypothetical protein YALI1_A06591g [Yarrowia lipolytica]KAB8281795.1 hypothetical protein BKA91DRAFT_139692 [Yarrowia lipolytica]KAE8170432.1 hypothetical protein BKA90DRAFT_140903 [Yarrowia lipolytica]KAJ8051431.1 hypothetical protein LXG23DRAFT_52567 [Yarrowia lipolytica]QNP95582.1 Hypothetical protein YALI2_A00581g [Yarrowia lipolytica]|eukprot:XP_499825.1 YALI0A06886p [Yarrowia lipolytica CLIB122]
MSLPPMLSPTLPPWTDCVQVEFPKMLSPTLPAVFEFGGSKKTAQKTGLSHEMKDKSFPVTLKVSKKALSRLDSKSDVSKATEDDAREGSRESKTNGRTENRKEKEEPSSSARSSASSARIPAARDLDKSTTPTKAKSKAVSPTRDEETKQQFKLLRKKMRTWLDLARAKKHMSDAKFTSEEFALASAAAMDSLLCYIIAFNYEERADILTGRVPQDKSWGSLVNFVNRVNFLLEAAKQPHLIGCCYLMRAMIHVRVGLVLGTQAKALARGGEGNDEVPPAETLALSLCRTQEGYTADFRRASRSLPLSQISQHFPQSYGRRSRTAVPVVHGGGYRPWSDEYALPLHVYSSLQEAAALGWNMTDEWIRTEGVKYEWACRALA